MSIQEVIEGRDFEKAVQMAWSKAMMTGYATSSLSTNVSGFPGSKRITVKVGMFLVTDTWHVTPMSTVSGGTTLISFEEIPVWMMHYFGFYSESAIPLLKQALYKNYKNRIFHGGRGPRYFGVDGSYWYENLVGKGSSFKKFSGEEQIHDKGPRCIGYHRYHGGSMIGF
ncbi:MAG: DUF5680 domain-containing protein [Minisyncoccia bacterium]